MDGDKHLGKVENKVDAKPITHALDQMWRPNGDMQNYGHLSRNQTNSSSAMELFGDVQLIADDQQSSKPRRFLRGSLSGADSGSGSEHNGQGDSALKNPVKTHKESQIFGNEDNSTTLGAPTDQQLRQRGSIEAENALPPKATPDDATLSGSFDVPFTAPNNTSASDSVTVGPIPASDYHENANYGRLPIPQSPTKSNYYNFLQNAHYKNNELVGQPIHVENGKTIYSYPYEIGIPLQKSESHKN